MSILTQTTQSETHGTGPRPRRAREIVRGKAAKPPEALFDAFWRAGELALLFGEPDSGKSVLAVQIADSIARGKPAEVVSGRWSVANKSKKKKKVLYIDLVLSEKQFKERYS